VISNTSRDYQAKVLSATADFLILSREAYNYNTTTLRLQKIFSEEVSIVQKWRKIFFSKLKSRVDSNEPIESIEKSTIQEKFKANYFEKTEPFIKKTSISMNKPNFTKENQEVVGENLKKSQKNLLRIIKSSEYVKRLYSERDQLALIQVQMSQKMLVFGKKNKEKSFIDLSIEDQKAKLDEMLKKKLMIFNNNQKKSPKKHSILRKIQIFPENREIERIFCRNLNFRVKKSQSFANPVKEKHREGSLQSFIVKNSLNPY